MWVGSWRWNHDHAHVMRVTVAADGQSGGVEHRAGYSGSWHWDRAASGAIRGPTTCLNEVAMIEDECANMRANRR